MAGIRYRNELGGQALLNGILGMWESAEKPYFHEPTSRDLADGMDD